MATDMGSDKEFGDENEFFYEEIASREEIYLEQTEEEVRAILIFEDPAPAQNDPLSPTEDSADQELDEELQESRYPDERPDSPQSLEMQINTTKEQLDAASNDAPLSKETIVAMLRMI